jgi:ribokinase
VTGTVVVVGSLNADLVVQTERFPQPGETLHGSDLQTLPGGKSANQAVAAGRLGGTVRMVGAVGDDGNGALLRDSVAAAGVDTTTVPVTPSLPVGRRRRRPRSRRASTRRASPSGPARPPGPP